MKNSHKRTRPLGFKLSLRVIPLLIAGVFLLLIPASLAATKPEIVVILTGFQSDQGYVLLSLHNQEKSFPGDSEGAKKLARATIKNRKAILRLKDVGRGRYAISVFHDENNNRKLDTNFLGIPKEAVGASNNASGLMGPPKWKDAVFELKNKSVTQRINLKKP